MKHKKKKTRWIVVSEEALKHLDWDDLGIRVFKDETWAREYAKYIEKTFDEKQYVLPSIYNKGKCPK